MFFLLFVLIGYKIFPIKCNFKNVKFILAATKNRIYGISPFSIYNPPAVREIHPADIPAASPEPVTPVSHPMAQELLYDRWGADGSPACGLPSCKHYGLFYPRLPYLFEDGETEPASLSVKLQSVLY